jgi:hypothetical protein
VIQWSINKLNSYKIQPILEGIVLAKALIGDVIRDEKGIIYKRVLWNYPYKSILLLNK